MKNTFIKMKNSLNKTLLLAIAGSMLLVTVAFAGTGNVSEASITSTQTGSDGGSVLVTNGTNVTLYGNNLSTSTNSLWAEDYEDLYGNDQLKKNFQVYAGNNVSQVYTTNGGNHYIHLDPDGPFYTGCNGNGTLAN